MNDRLTRINENIDAVVMFTASNWKTELRSNRYHYATRFAALYPVIFIQPDLPGAKFSFESTEVDGLHILHVYSNFYSPRQAELIAEALNIKGIISPLIWVYNPRFINVITQIYSPYKIYHATEDYFSLDYRSDFSINDFCIKSLMKLLDIVDDIVCVSQGVYTSILNTNTKWIDKLRVISNGCDYEFYAEELTSEGLSPFERQKNTALYQGNIFKKVDLDLLFELVNKMPSWDFWFCGPLLANSSKWKRFFLNKNTKYFGVLTPHQVRELSYKATVGIIPFQKTENLVKNSLPLKAFEYIASGLPVVTTPINSLRDFDDLFLFADNADEFVDQLNLAERCSYDRSYLKKSLKIASTQSYNKKFIEVIQGINSTLKNRKYDVEKLNVLMLYEPKSLKVGAIKDHVGCFYEFSSHNIYYASATSDYKTIIDLACFDVVVIHFSLRLSVRNGVWTLSYDVRKFLKKFLGLKIAFIQDEYDATNVAIAWLKDLGVQLVFTCVPEKYIRTVYSIKELPYVLFVNNLTGYVPTALIDYPVSPVANRTIQIAYRGRNLPFWYGDLGQEKEFIGKKMKTICVERGIKEDIAWDATSRIYGDLWPKFMAQAKAILGTESGANVFDFTGKLRNEISGYIDKNPNISYKVVFDKFLQQHEGLIQMNQISPKIFEAICLKTVLILFEGEYSGVLKPNMHYIPLKKDFSNVDDVLAQISDDDYLTCIAENAFRDIVKSGKYSYQAFVKLFDKTISELMRSSKNKKIVNISRTPLFEDVVWYKKWNSIDISMLAFRFRRFVIDRIKIFNPILRKIQQMNH